MRFRVYIAASVDGHIATPDGGIAWLDAYPAEDFGFAAFFAGIGTVVMGRATFDQVHGFTPWPYAGKPTVVLTRRPLPERPPAGVAAFAGDPGVLAADLRTAGGGDVWLAGGARTIRGFLDRGLVDSLELFVIPVLLGGGIPLFPPSTRIDPLALADVRAGPGGVVRLVYTCHR